MVKTLILGLGNELLADDRIGILAVREIKKRISDKADVVESSLSGIALLDIFLGYERAIIIDAIQTNRYPAGSIIELTADDLDSVIAPSPHYAGLPEMLALAKQLQLDFPEEIKIFAIEVQDAHTIGGELSYTVKQALPELVRRVEESLI